MLQRMKYRLVISCYLHNLYSCLLDRKIIKIFIFLQFYFTCILKYNTLLLPYEYS